MVRVPKARGKVGPRNPDQSQRLSAHSEGKLLRMATRSAVLSLALATLAAAATAQRAPGEEYISRVPGMAEYRVRKTETDSLGMIHTCLLYTSCCRVG